MDNWLTRINDAIEHDSIDMMNSALEMAPPGTLEEYGQDCLTYAVIRTSPWIVGMLLDKGFDPNISTSPYRLSLLHILVEDSMDKNRDQMVRLLVDRGARLTDLDNNNATLLHLVARDGLDDVLGVFIEYGMDVNAKTKNGETPFDMAVMRDNLSCVRCLVEAGANIWTEPITVPRSDAMYQYLGHDLPRFVRNCRDTIRTILLIRKFRAAQCGAFGQMDVHNLRYILELIWASRRLAIWESKK